MRLRKHVQFALNARAGQQIVYLTARDAVRVLVSDYHRMRHAQFAQYAAYLKQRALTDNYLLQACGVMLTAVAVIAFGTQQRFQRQVTELFHNKPS